MSSDFVPYKKKNMLWLPYLKLEIESMTNNLFLKSTNEVMIHNINMKL
jgi:hypothetical protein